jgi:hypothetical protein
MAARAHWFDDDVVPPPVEAAEDGAEADLATTDPMV